MRLLTISACIGARNVSTFLAFNNSFIPMEEHINIQFLGDDEYRLRFNLTFQLII